MLACSSSTLSFLLIVAIISTSLDYGNANINATQDDEDTAAEMNSEEIDQNTEEAGGHGIDTTSLKQHPDEQKWNIGALLNLTLNDEDIQNLHQNVDGKAEETKTTTEKDLINLEEQQQQQSDEKTWNIGDLLNLTANVEDMKQHHQNNDGNEEETKTTTEKDLTTRPNRTENNKSTTPTLPQTSETSESLESEELMADEEIHDNDDSEYETDTKEFLSQKITEENKLENSLNHKETLEKDENSMDQSSGDGERSSDLDEFLEPSQNVDDDDDNNNNEDKIESKAKPKLLAALGSNAGASFVQEDQPLVAGNEQCHKRVCHDPEDLSVKISASEGLIIPSGINLTIRCTVVSALNNSAQVKWHLPPKVAKGPNVDYRKAQTEEDEEENGKWTVSNPRVNITHEFYEQRAKGKRTVISTLRVFNITDSDSGKYTCFATSNNHCCHRNATVALRIYTPPSYALDFAIIGAVCFIEFVVILYFKTRGNKSKKVAISRSGGDNYSADYTPIPTDKDNFKDIEQAKT